MHVSQLDQNRLRSSIGKDILFEALHEVYPEGAIKRLPRYGALTIAIEYKTGRNVVPLFEAFELVMGVLEGVGPNTEMADEIMGFLVLDLLKLTEVEEARVFSTSRYSMAYSKLKPIICQFYPNGSVPRTPQLLQYVRERTEDEHQNDEHLGEACQDEEHYALLADAVEVALANDNLQ